ncbi:MAG: hypothetical protein ABW212_14635, partial [Pseudonocardia sediminis]
MSTHDDSTRPITPASGSGPDAREPTPAALPSGTPVTDPGDGPRPRRGRFAALRRRSSMPVVAAAVAGLLVGGVATGLVVGTATASPGGLTGISADAPAPP